MASQQWNLNIPFEGSGSQRNQFLSSDTVPRSQASFSSAPMDRNFLSTQSSRSTNTTSSWETNMTDFTNDSNTSAEYEFIPDFKTEHGSQWGLELNTASMNLYAQPSPISEQASSLGNLSLYQSTIGPPEWNMPEPLQIYRQQSDHRSFEPEATFPGNHRLSQELSSSPSEHPEPLPLSTLANQYRRERENGPRHTPNSLGWRQKTAPLSDYVAKYELQIRKGKESYFELKKEYEITRDTPQRVYFDQPKIVKKNEHPCLYPGECDRQEQPAKKGQPGRKAQPFGRPADLERHLKNVHAPSDQQDSFRCDYKKCSSDRHTKPFTRKDHYRDHLKDFHKEDIGACKGEKAAKTEEERRQWEQDQARWLEERQIDASHWRCARCLVKKHVRTDNWECMRCKLPCEEERINARLRLPQKEVETMQVDDESAYKSYTDPADMRCVACVFSGYPGYVDDGFGQWIACASCAYEPAQTDTRRW